MKFIAMRSKLLNIKNKNLNCRNSQSTITEFKSLYIIYNPLMAHYHRKNKHKVKLDI